jgi:hypothetical protein
MISKVKFLTTVVFALLLLSMSGCARIEVRSLTKPSVNMLDYRTFTTVNQAKPEDENFLRDEILLNYISNLMTQKGYLIASEHEAKARVTLVFTEGYKKVFVPPSRQPVISYTEGEFTTVTGKIDEETVKLFGYIPPRRIESYIDIPGYLQDVYKLVLRIDIYDAKTLTMLWTGTAFMESSPGRAIDDAKKMIDKLIKERLPEL